MLSESTTEEVREFSEENFGDKKERLLHNTDRSIFVMGDWPHNFLTEGDEERIRNWEEENDIPADKLAFGFERLDFMASPYTFEEGANQYEPISNWINSTIGVDEWKRIFDSKDFKGERNVLRFTEWDLMNANSDLIEYLEQDSNTVMVNPPEVVRTTTDKLQTYRHFERKDIPTIPTFGGKEILDNLSLFDSVLEESAVIKPSNGSQGEGISHHESLDDVVDLLGGDEDYIVQKKINHASDLRVVIAGYEDSLRVVNAERRFNTDEDFRTNLSLKEGEVGGNYYGELGKAYNAFNRNLVEPINVDLKGRIPDKFKNHPQILSEGARELTYDIATSFVNENYVDTGLKPPPLFLGIDLMEVSEEDIQSLGQGTVEKAQQYESNGTYYLATEVNPELGSIIDRLATSNGLDHQNNVYHLSNLMLELASDEKLEEEQFREYGREEYWRKDSYFPNMEYWFNATPEEFAEEFPEWPYIEVVEEYSN